MKKISRRSFLAASGILAAGAALTACGSSSTSDNTASSTTATTATTSGKHEPITLLQPFKNMTAFLEDFNAKYPDIEIQIIPYSGQNTTAFVEEQLKAGDVPDIYFTTVYAKGTDFSETLLDLSAYPFTDNYSESFLRSVREDDGVFLLPICYNAIGITYNKNLFEEHGWTLPNNMDELADLKTKAEEAGCDFSLTQLNLPGYGFQYFFNVASAGWFSTLEGLQWQADFLTGDATVAGSPDMMGCVQRFERYHQIGMIDGDNHAVGDTDVAEKMQEGNTLFMLGTANNFFAAEGNEGKYFLMPFLSDDSEHNVFMSNISRYIGLSAKLEEPGNEQKLQDALTFMDYISHAENMSLFTSATLSNYILPLKDYVPSQDSFFKEIQGQLDAGMVAPLIIGGRWSNTVVPIGNKVIDYLCGNAAIEDVVNTIDESKSLMDDVGEVCTTATEKIDNDACVQWVGIAYVQATGADAALITQNRWYSLEPGKLLNTRGVNGCLYPVPITDQEITAVIPQGWTKKLETMQLTGKEINDLLANGYDYNEEGEYFFPYTLVAPDGFTVDESKTYTIVYCGMTDPMKETHEWTDTGILGLDAARTYLSQFETFSNKDIHWN